MSFAQEIKVLEFYSLPQDLTARTHPRTDNNGDPCALIKVEIPGLNGVSFEGNIIDTTYIRGEYYVYVTAGTKKITVKCIPNYYSCPYEFPEKIEGNVTYKMKLTYDRVSSYVESSVTAQFVSFVVSPPDAYLEFDDKPLPLKNGQASTANPVPFGEYSYRVEAENFHPENGKVKVNDPDNSIVVNVTLKPAYGSLEVSGESVRGGTVYLDKKDIGIAPVSLEIVPSGKHTIKVAKNMYNPYEEEIEITDGKNTLVKPIMQPNFQNITFKVEENAEIWINGKLRGTGYVKDDFEAGTLFVECKKEKHRTTSANYPSVAGESSKTITLAKPIPIYGILLVKSTPIDADVFVDGENKGKTPRQLAQTIIGSHKVRILKEGYLPYEETVTILEGQTETVDVDLDNMIKVKFSCNAGHIPLKVDGVNVGYADGSYPISIGKHQIECNAEGYNPYKETFEVKSDTRSYSIVMESVVAKLELSKSTINAESSGESFKINVSTDASQWEIANKPSWCEIKDKTRNSFTLNLLPNNSTSSRSAPIVIAAGKKSETIYVSQQGKSYSLSLSKSTIYANASGESFKINVSTNAPHWEVAKKPSWCEIKDKKYNSFTLNLLSNNSTSTRHGSIKIATGNERATISVSQQGKNKNAQPLSNFFGVNLGLGYQGNAAFGKSNFSLGIDWAWGNNYDANAYGFFLSYRTVDNITVGPLFIFNHFIMGVGANINFGWFIDSDSKSGSDSDSDSSSRLPDGVLFRKINMGCDGVLRLGVRGQSFYLFAEGGLGKISGFDNLYNEVTEQTESHNWSKLNWHISLNLGLFFAK